MTNSMLGHALALAARGFHVFPLKVRGKTPAHDGWQDEATTDPAKIAAMWEGAGYNVGIFTSKFGPDRALLVVDVDNKGEKNGDEQLLRLEMGGNDFPSTYTQSTPSGGRHLVYVVDDPVKQGANVLASGLDTRSRGGYIVGAGSVLGSGAYTGGDGPLSPAPQWLIDVCGRGRDREPATDVDISRVDAKRAARRAVEYLATAPVAVEGQGGDETTYKVACRLKDLGLDEAAAGLAMVEWNYRCSPPWSMEELEAKVHNAYRYGTEAPGAAAPEAQFPPIEPEKEAAETDEHPIRRLNREYAFIIAGGTGNILWETTDPEGNFSFQLLNKSTFQDRLACQTLQVGKRNVPLTTAWMESPDRRAFDGLVFEPGRDMGKRWYNMWRGFTCEPVKGPASHWALDMWLDHARDNVCGGSDELFKWLITWFAHLVQRPYEKPLVAVVFKGKKGTGKNALIERVGRLLGGHFLLTSRRRYITSNFTGHLQRCLMFVMDEAFWSGDKEAEGVVKDLITGAKHNIELKGREPYDVRNLTRVGVIGNEDWVVPASHDERRWAVFDIGEGRMQDRAYFEKMRVGIDNQGGNRHLLRFLLDWDLATADVNKAPQTRGLLDQKIASLEPFEQWWLDCLTEGHLTSSDFSGEWPEAIECERLRSAFGRYLKERNIRTRAPDSRSIGRTLAKILGDVKKDRGPKSAGQPWRYVMPPLDVARARWDAFIGHRGVWE